MDTGLIVAIPNWITAITGFLAFLAAGIAVILAARTYRAERRRDEREEAEARAQRARSVTASWVTRWRTSPNTRGERVEVGLALQNSNSVAVHNVRVTASARGQLCELPVIDPLQSGTMFLRKNRRDSNMDFDVRRMDVGIADVIPILKQDWLVLEIAFELEGEPLVWRATSATTTK